MKFKLFQISPKYVILSFLILLCCNDSGANYKTPIQTIKIFATGQIQSYHPNDDGALKKGIKWTTERFSINHNGTITDNLSGLMWERQPLQNNVNWKGAFKRIFELNNKKFAGYQDWRLPNINELFSLTNYGYPMQIIWLEKQGFLVIKGNNNYFWSSTTYMNDSNLAICMCFSNGLSASWEKNQSIFIPDPHAKINFYVIGVRTAKQGKIKLPATGQLKSYTHFDDGALKIGVKIPKYRFIINQNGTITDRFTKLIWKRDVSLKKYKWKEAFQEIQKLNLNKFGGYSDWRLPNINECRSLMLYRKKPFKYLEENGFTNIQEIYWTSTTRSEIQVNRAYVIDYGDSLINLYSENDVSSAHILAVRGGH